MEGIQLAAQPLARSILRECFFVYVQEVFREVESQKNLCDLQYLEVFCSALERTCRSERGRLIVNLPPRHLKSFTLCCLAAWVLARNPSLQIITVTYGEELSRQLSRTFHSIVTSKIHRATFGSAASQPASDRLTEYRTQAGGYWRTATSNGPLTGIGGDIILIDDLVKAQEVHSPVLRDAAVRFVEEVLLGRLNSPAQGVVISCQQRLHANDIVARLIETGEFELLSLPARAIRPERHDLYYERHWDREPGDLLAPCRFSAEELEIIRARNPYTFAAQHQQDPLHDADAMVDLSKITFLPEIPPRDELLCVLQCWDTASSDQPDADYSVGVTCGFDGEIWYLMDIVRGRFRFPTLKEMVIEAANRWRPDKVKIEHASSGIPLAQQLHAEGYRFIQSINVQLPKDVRLFSQTEFLESNRFAVLEGVPHQEALRRELGQFPMGGNDDIVDALSLFANLVTGPGRFVDQMIYKGRLPRRSSGSRKRYYLR